MPAGQDFEPHTAWIYQPAGLYEIPSSCSSLWRLVPMDAISRSSLGGHLHRQPIAGKTTVHPILGGYSSSPRQQLPDYARRCCNIPFISFFRWLQPLKISIWTQKSGELPQFVLLACLWIAFQPSSSVPWLHAHGFHVMHCQSWNALCKSHAYNI